MSQIKGFICYNCGHEERYPDEVGIKAAENKESFQCEECQAITISVKVYSLWALNPLAAIKSTILKAMKIR